MRATPQECPEYKSNIFIRLTFSWITPLLKEGYKRPLEAADIWELPPPDQASKVGKGFDRHWQQQQECGALWLQAS
jgi:hypothetical protein